MKATKGPNSNPGLVCWELHKHIIEYRSFPYGAIN